MNWHRSGSTSSPQRGPRPVLVRSPEADREATYDSVGRALLLCRVAAVLDVGYEAEKQALLPGEPGTLFTALGYDGSPPTAVQAFSRP